MGLDSRLKIDTRPLARSGGARRSGLVLLEAVALVVCGASAHAAAGSPDDPLAQRMRPADVADNGADSVSMATLLYKGIVQYDLESKGRTDLFPLMATAVAAGVSVKETPAILRSLARAGLGYQRARQQGGGSDPLVGWRIDDVVVHAARAIERQNAGLEDDGLFSVLADGQIWDAYTRSDNAAMSDRRFRRQASEGALTVPMAQSVILDAYTRAFHGVPQLRVVDALFAGELGVSPGSPLPLLAEAATARFGEKIPHILEHQHNEDELVAVHGRTLDAVREDHLAMMRVLSESLAKLETGVDQVEKGTEALTRRAEDEHKAREKAREKAGKNALIQREMAMQRQEFELGFAGAQSILNLTAELVARKNPEVAIGLQRMGSASMLAMKGFSMIAMAKGMSGFAKGLGTAGGGGGVVPRRPLADGFSGAAGRGDRGCDQGAVAAHAGDSPGDARHVRALGSASAGGVPRRGCHPSGGHGRSRGDPQHLARDD